MRKIAVYGDSFATDANNLDTSWFVLLGKKLNCEVDTYGEAGSSVYYSYKKFMETHRDYDLCVFLVTSPNRFPVKVEFSSGERYNVPGLNAIDFIKESLAKTDTMDSITLSNLQGWFKSSDIEYLTDMKELMLDKIKSLKEDTIFVPCFNDSFSVDRMEPGLISVFDLFNRQKELLGDTSKTSLNLMRYEKVNVISAHMTPEFNAFFATVVYNKIQTGQWDFSEYKRIQLQYSKEHYYE